MDFDAVSTVGLESTPVAAALAGLRAHVAGYFKNKHDRVFTVEPASNPNARAAVGRVHRILKKEHDIVISSRPHTIDDPKKRAVGFKLSEGMELPPELASRSKFASMKSKLAGNHPRFLLRIYERLLTLEHRSLRSQDAKPCIGGEEDAPRFTCAC